MRVWISRSTPILALFVPAIVVFHSWFSGTVLTQGDWLTFTTPRMKELLPFPSLLDTATSLGSYNLAGANYFPLFALQAVLSRFGAGFAVSERIVWYYPIVGGSLLSSYLLARTLWGHPWWSLLGAWLYAFNAYILMIVEDNGHVGVAGAYALAPLVLVGVIRYLDAERVRPWQWLLVVGSVALQICYDLRITYLTVMIAVLYTVYWAVGSVRDGGKWENIAMRVALRGVLAAVPLAALEAWWVLPTLTIGGPRLSALSSGSQWIAPASFMQMSHSLTLVHPFWPRNWFFSARPAPPVLFGVPLIIAVLLLRPIRDARVLFLLTVALGSAFMVKGANAPFGGAYYWMFAHVPGFSFFRDPSKLFLGVALPYAALFPLAAARIGSRLSELRPAGLARATRALWVTACVALVVFPATPALGLFGQSFLGSLSPSPAAHRGWPPEYSRLDAWIDRQPYFRLLWVPEWERFGPTSERHPAISASTLGQTYFPDRVAGFRWIARPTTPRLLELLSVRYVAVPDDVYHDVYPYFPPHGRDWYVALCRRSLPGWRETRYGKVVLFENPRFVPRVFLSSPPSGGASAVSLSALKLSHLAELALPSNRARVRLLVDSTTHLEMAVPRLVRPTALVLADDFSPLWYITVRTTAGRTLTDRERRAITGSQRMVDGYANGWILPPGPGYRVTLDYYPQQVMMRGAVVSLAGVLACLVLAFLLSLWQAGWLRVRRPIGSLPLRRPRPTEVA